MITNRLNLPQPWVTAASTDDYDRGADTWRTVTELIGPPRIAVLRQRYPDQVTQEDVVDRAYLVMGKAMHHILHSANTVGLAELRLALEISNRIISGQFDHFDLVDGILTDFKGTSVWAVVFGDRMAEWTAQLNSYRYLLEAHGYQVNGLQITAYLDGWSRTTAKKERQVKDSTYPQSKIVVLPVAKWSLADTRTYLEHRIWLHEDALEHLPHCTAADRWQKPPKWALMRAGRKSAVKLYDVEITTTPPGHYIEVRPSLPARCLDFCPMRTLCPTLGDGQFTAAELEMMGGDGNDGLRESDGDTPQSGGPA